MAKRSAARRREEDTGRDDPSRPDNILPQTGDDAGSVVDAVGKEDVIDVNAPARDDDARSDADKQKEKQDREEAEQIRQRQTETGDARSGRDDDDDAAERRRQRRQNREREAGRGSDERVTNLTTQLRKANDRLKKLERGGSQKEIEATIGGMKAQIESLKKDLIAHTEGGKTAEAMDAQIKIGEIQAKLALAERDLEIAKRQPDPADDDKADDKGAEAKQPQIVQDWLRANRRWWSLPSAEALRRASVVIDNQILADIDEGELDFDKYSDDHVDEMTRRLVKKLSV